MNPVFTLLIIAAFIIILIFIYIRFFFRHHHGFMRFVKYILLPITVMGGWIVYFTGYSMGSEEATTFHSVVMHALQAVFSAGRLFVLGNDLVEVSHEVKQNPNYLLWFSLIGTLAVFLSISILLNVFGKRLITRIRIWLKLSKENHVFFGVNEASVSLAKDLIQRDRSRLVVFIKKLDKQEDETLYHTVEETGALVINSESFLESISLRKEEGIIQMHQNPAMPENLKKFRLIRKVIKCPSHLYFLTDREEWNMSTARSVLNESGTFSIDHAITFHIRINGADLEEAFYGSLSAPHPNIHIKLLNYSEVAARQLIALHNPADWITKDTENALATQDFNVLIVGFDQTGNAALLKLIEYGQFANSTFNAIITDRSPEVKKGRFENRFQGLMSQYNIEFFEAEAGSSRFFDLVLQHIHNLDFIVITLGNDALNIQTAVDIQQLILASSAGKLKIIAQVKNNENYKHLFSPCQDAPIHIFGRIQDIFTEDIVVRGKLEAMAIRIHEYYNSKKNETKRKTWDELTRIEQASNISAAEHIYIKLSLAGLNPSVIKSLPSQKEFVDLLGNNRLKNLAMGEHLHWNAILFAHGWNIWPLSEIPPGIMKNKDNQRKLHACLVDWDDLARIEKRFGEDYYQYDMDTIANIFQLIKEGIYYHS